jgi:hypothetical protein
VICHVNESESMPKSDDMQERESQNFLTRRLKAAMPRQLGEARMPIHSGAIGNDTADPPCVWNTI